MGAGAWTRNNTKKLYILGEIGVKIAGRLTRLEEPLVSGVVQGEDEPLQVEEEEGHHPRRADDMRRRQHENNQEGSRNHCRHDVEQAIKDMIVPNARAILTRGSHKKLNI